MLCAHAVGVFGWATVIWFRPESQHCELKLRMPSRCVAMLRKRGPGLPLHLCTLPGGPHHDGLPRSDTSTLHTASLRRISVSPESDKPVKALYPVAAWYLGRYCSRGA